MENGLLLQQWAKETIDGNLISLTNFGLSEERLPE